jgi:hypothetical protein
VECDEAENIPAEECCESKVYRINTINDKDQPRVLQGPTSSRSGGQKLFENPIRHVVKVKNVNRARQTGSVEAQK